MVRFKIQNAEEKQQLKELVESGIVGMRDTYTVAERYPKWYLYFETEHSIQGVSEFVYNTFANSDSLTFCGFYELLERVGHIG